MKSKNSLYLHIPFCKKICCYCDFPKVFAIEPFIAGYLKALHIEIRSQPLSCIKTLYLGGGTPFCLSSIELEALLDLVSTHHSLTSLEEFTVESTIEDLDEEKLLVLKKYGLNRVSIGVQTLHHYPYLNRVSDISNLETKVALLHQLKINDINFDLIYGWPESKESDFLEDLEKVIAQNPTHISIYPLAIEKGTLLYNKGTVPLEDDEYASQYDKARRLLECYGFYRYEVSNFSLAGKRSKHNLTYWKGENYLAAGLGAASYTDHRRITRTRSLARYIGLDFIESVEIEDKQEEMNDFIMLNLRLEDGFSRLEFKARFDLDFINIYQKEVNKVCEYLIIDDERIKVKPEYIYILDSILVDLLK